MSNSGILVEWKALRDFCMKVFIAVGLSKEDAFIVADSLVDADLNGIESHGVSRMPIYVRRLNEKVVEKKCEMTVEKENRSSLALNANNGMGIVAGFRAVEMGIKKAKDNGVVAITLNNSNHFGTAAYFSRIALENDMIGIAATNAPSTMAPWGGIKPYMGTNPFSVAIPAGLEKPIIMDMATSVVAQGKIIMAAKTGAQIPLGWAITNEGEPTTDAKKGLEGSVLPFGGPKGYSIAVLIDILCGVLSGAFFGPHINNMWNDFKRPQNLGHFFFFMEIKQFIDINIFKERIDQMIREIKASPKAKGIKEIFLPGEIELNSKTYRMEKGVPVSQQVFEDLTTLAKDYHVHIRNLGGN